jgi:hypothetical protein
MENLIKVFENYEEGFECFFMMYEEMTAMEGK